MSMKYLGSDVNIRFYLWWISNLKQRMSAVGEWLHIRIKKLETRTPRGSCHYGQFCRQIDFGLHSRPVLQ